MQEETKGGVMSSFGAHGGPVGGGKREPARRVIVVDSPRQRVVMEGRYNAAGREIYGPRRDEARAGIERLFGGGPGAGGYGGGEEMPLQGYLAIMSGFVGAAAAVMLGIRSRERRARRRAAQELIEHEMLLREDLKRTTRPRIEPFDVVLLGLATHKLTRILTKDWVTAPLRAPFTRYRGSAGGGEVKEEPRDDAGSVRKAIGQLVTCEYCTAPWVAGVMSVGLLLVPRLTRRMAALLGMVAVAHWLHAAFERLRGGSTGGSTGGSIGEGDAMLIIEEEVWEADPRRASGPSGGQSGGPRDQRGGW
jgi:hypothetical protein